MGVWIETNRAYLDAMNAASHPVWVCGLKLLLLLIMLMSLESHPVWVCGLKQISEKLISSVGQSHPVWVCGLKLIDKDTITQRWCHTLYGCVD